MTLLCVRAAVDALNDAERVRRNWEGCRSKDEVNLW